MTDKEAIKRLKEARNTIQPFRYVDEAIDHAIKALEQSRPKGKWHDKTMKIKGKHGLAYGRYGCSICKKKFPNKSSYCPNCGAEMEV